MGPPASAVALAVLAVLLAGAACASKPRSVLTYDERASKAVLLAHQEAAGFRALSQPDGLLRTLAVWPRHSDANITAQLRALHAAPSVPQGESHQAGAAAAEAPLYSGEYVAMCLIVRNQHEDLLEWLEHYLKLGVGRIYIYDHGSMPPVLPVFAHLVAAGVVDHRLISDATVIAVSPERVRKNGRVNVQSWVYKQCLAEHRLRHRWMAFFDSDEFLLLMNASIVDLPGLLLDYEAYGALAVSWRMFGTSGLKERPNGTVLGSYWRCHTSGTVKVIVNTQYGVETAGNPHAFTYRGDKHAVDEHFKPVEGPFMQFTQDRVVLNHYVTKSRAEFAAKQMRGSGAGSMGKTKSFMRAVDAKNRKHNMNCGDGVRLMAGREWRRGRAHLVNLGNKTLA